MEIQYNAAQLQAIYSNEPKIVVRAPAGSGKTASLCGAIQEYSALHPTHTITAITFTRKAADELAHRVNNPRVKQVQYILGLYNNCMLLAPNMVLQ